MMTRRATLVLLVVLLAAGCESRQPLAPVVFNVPGTRLAVPPAATIPGRIVVVRGDTVYAIARRYSVSVRGVIDVNRLRPPYKLLVGQVLALPRERVHEVRRGDTLYSISRRYRVDMSVLARANGLSEPYRLGVGRRLRVPWFAAAPPAAAAKRQVPLAAAKRQVPLAAALPPPTPKPAPRSRRTFLWPVEGKLVSRFGPKAGGLHNDGINISAPRGAAVRAAEDGVVAYAGNELGGYGNLVLVRHAGGWTSAYAHNEKLLVSRGNTVRRGQVIALVGSSGNVTTPQTHFELRRGARAVDPLKSLASN